MIIKINAKCSDLFSARLHENGKEKFSDAVAEYDGYVPEWFPGDHYGDYVELEIDTDTGKILNWKKPSKKELKKTFGNWEGK
jgi:hypothetical protein